MTHCFSGEGSTGKIAVKRLVNDYDSNGTGEQAGSRAHRSEIAQQFNKEIEILSRFASILMFLNWEALVRIYNNIFYIVCMTGNSGSFRKIW